MTSKTDAGIIQNQKDADGYVVYEYETDENGDFVYEQVEYDGQIYDEKVKTIKTTPLKDIQKLTILILGHFIASKIISISSLSARGKLLNIGRVLPYAFLQFFV